MRFFTVLLILMAPHFLAPSARAEFGCRFVANERLATVLDSSAKKLSFRFTCQEDMTLAAASVYCVEATASPAYKISLQENKGGVPSGIPLSFSSYVPLRKSWSTLPLKTLPLVKGRIYHLVLEHDPERGGDHPVGVIGAAHCASFLSTDVLNRMHPNDGSPDTQANTLSFEGGRWKALDQEPVYMVYGVGFQAQGNPYDAPSTRPVHGSADPADRSRQVLQGQVLHFHCPFWAKAFAVRVKKKGTLDHP